MVLRNISQTCRSRWIRGCRRGLAGELPESQVVALEGHMPVHLSKSRLPCHDATARISCAGRIPKSRVASGWESWHRRREANMRGAVKYPERRRLVTVDAGRRSPERPLAMACCGICRIWANPPEAIMLSECECAADCGARARAEIVARSSRPPPGVENKGPCGGPPVRFRSTVPMIAQERLLQFRRPAGRERAKVCDGWTHSSMSSNPTAPPKVPQTVANRSHTE
jgi:hypothetical protein